MFIRNKRNDGIPIKSILLVLSFISGIGLVRLSGQEMRLGDPDQILPCNQISWFDWALNSSTAYRATNGLGDTVYLQTDPKSALLGLYDLEFLNPVFQPKIVGKMPAPFMPGGNVFRLVHKLDLSRAKHKDSLYLFIASCPNSKKGFSGPQYVRLRFYDSNNNRLNVGGIQMIFRDPSIYFLSTTQIAFNSNEIVLLADDNVNLGDGDILIFNGFPANLEFIEVEHNDDRSFTWDGVYINVGLPVCCTAKTVDYQVKACDTEDNRYSVNVSLNASELNLPGELSLEWDGLKRFDFSLPSRNPFIFKLDSLVPDGKDHLLCFRFNQDELCKTCVKIKAPDPPAKVRISSQTPLCEGDEIHLSASLTGAMEWTGPNQFQSPDSSVRIGNVTGSDAGVYTLRLKDPSGCISRDSINIQVYPKSHTDTVVRSCNEFIWNGMRLDKTGQYSLILKNVNSCDSIVTLSLLIGNSTIDTIRISACDSFIFKGMVYRSTGLYAFPGQNISGCDSSIVLNLQIEAELKYLLKAGTDFSACLGDTIQLAGSYDGPGRTRWNSTGGFFSNSDNLITNYYVHQASSHFVYLAASEKCRDQLDSVWIEIIQPNELKLTVEPLQDPCMEPVVSIQGAGQYSWWPSEFIECLDPPCSRVRIKSGLNQKLIVQSDGLCDLPLEWELRVSRVGNDLFVPNAFTPNGDQINDIFMPVFKCPDIDDYLLQIFDRWGNMLFESRDVDLGWNGNFHEDQLKPGVFVYLISYRFLGGPHTVVSGDVSLIR